MMTEAQVDELIGKMLDPTDEQAFKYADRLAKNGGSYVQERMLALLYAEEQDTKDLAARALKHMDDNQDALEPLLVAINDKRNKNRNGMMVDALENFDLSEKFVEILKLYLFGNFKVSALAKMLLNFKEFDITPRVLRKAEKHWKHYCNNVRKDDEFELKKKEVESIFKDLRELLSS